MKEALEKLEATKEECITVFGHGDIVKRKNAKTLIDIMKRHAKELKEAMLDKDFAEAAFLYEMNDHKYAINRSADEDVLDCFRMSFEELRKLGLTDAYRRSRYAHMKNAQKWGMI